MTALPPIPSPVAARIVASTIAATHSMRSCPYGCSLSDFLLDIRTPMMTTMVLNTSEAEWTASLIMAPELAAMPAKSLNADNTTFATMLTKETFMATASKLFDFNVLLIIIPPFQGNCLGATLFSETSLSMASAIRIY